MGSPFPLNDDDQNELPKSVVFWWRKAGEFDESGHLMVDLSNLSQLTPRLKLLREMERLALVAGEGLDDLRYKLISYRSGDFWLPVGGMKKEDMEIPPVITILLAGLIGSGKSSLVNMMYSVLGRSGLIPFAQTSSGSSHCTTMFLEEHNVVRSPRSGFYVYDTRGLDHLRMEDGLAEVSTWMILGVRHNQQSSRPGDEKLLTAGILPKLNGSLITNARYIKRKVNCLMIIANLAEINEAFQSGDLQPVEAIRDLFQCHCIRKSNENPLLILTHGDKLKTEERIKSRLKICEYLDIAETTGAYDIACLTEQGILPESDPITAFALTEAVYRSIMISDRSHQPKRKVKDWILIFFSCVMSFIASFFNILAQFFSRFEHKKNI